MSDPPLEALRRRLERRQKQASIAWAVLERDYLFSWILAAIARQDKLKDTMAFKGGACLKKCYFGDYRFSEDLDFTSTERTPMGDDLEKTLRAACLDATQLMRSVGEVRLELEPYVEREAHPHGQEAFVIRGQMPWQSRPQVKMKIEVTREEQTVWPFERRPVLHEYGEQMDGELTVYSLHEIVTEKLRAILQQMSRQESRGWVRPRGRDYYDLWRILKTHPELLEGGLALKEALRVKCQAKAVAFTDASSFFPEAMIQAVARTWQSWLSPLVSDLPQWETVFQELRPMIEQLLES